MAKLRTPLRDVVGDRTAKVLADSLHLYTVHDLLRHYPRRYAERGQLTDLRDVRVGEHVTVLAQVKSVRSRPIKGGRHMLEVAVTDGRTTLGLTWFSKGSALWRSKELREGRQVLFSGKVTEFNSKRQLTNPEYQLLDAEAGDSPEAIAESFAGALIPVYPATEKLPSWRIGQCVRVTLDVLDAMEDPLPAAMRLRHGLRGLADAFRGIHRPDSLEDMVASKQRLKWDEAFVLQAVLAQRRLAARKSPATPRSRRGGGLVDAFERALPFDFTAGQLEISAELDADLAATHPMHRLLQGEVGSGKTVVALRAMLTVVDSGGQAVLMAPTEVLAAQHARSIRELLGPIAMAGELGGAEEATQVVLLTGSVTAAARRTALALVASGDAGIVVGTHALLEPDVVFADLALVVVDEQHRFGVEQRDVLRSKCETPPHVLVMTATPIPRTVAMTVYGDLETSTLAELPRGRAPIETHVVPVAEKPQWANRMWSRVRDEVARGHQAFVVCPRIGGDGGEGPESGAEDVSLVDDGIPDDARRPGMAVEDVFPLLRDDELAGLRVEMLHGRMRPDDKDAVMQRFSRGEADVVVATTVIEVGVDVPNATAMVVLDADRFGISQLHQLRGRVGRGGAAAVCLLVTELPADAPGRERVEAVAATLDGFELARLDLARRREGDVLGTSQAGRQSSLRLLELLADEDLIRTARAEAISLVEEDPTLWREPALRSAIEAAVDTERAEFLEKG
ncbi:MAG TPA: ATP-dependent DNA helicase RecG [Mycobacteriales bacterium]|nr:ATP-dependent DNA helicase RecG [Mycobacteriales bacterium]